MRLARRGHSLLLPRGPATSASPRHPRQLPGDLLANRVLQPPARGRHTDRQGVACETRELARERLG